MMALLLAGLLATRAVRIEPPAPCPDDGRIPISETTKITEPGHYYLTRDITVDSGPALLIAGPEVTLDLNGHTVTAALTGFAIEVVPSPGATKPNNVHLRIHNGRLRGTGGISLHGEDFADPEFLSLDGLDIGGFVSSYPLYSGVSLSYFEGRGPWMVNIQNSKISGGISVQSNLHSVVVRMFNNTIEDGIYLKHPEACEIRGNLITGSIVIEHDHGGNEIQDNSLHGIELNAGGTDELTRSRNRILNNLLEGWMVIASGFGGNLIQGNTVGGIEINPSSTGLMGPGRGDRIVDNLLKGGGIRVLTSDTRVEGNQIIGEIGGGSGIEVGNQYNLPQRVHIEGNQIHGFDCGIRFHAGDDHVYRNNNVRGNGVAGIAGECGGSLGTNFDGGGNIL